MQAANCFALHAEMWLFICACSLIQLLHSTPTSNPNSPSLIVPKRLHQAVLLLRPLVSVTGKLRCRATALKPPQRVTAFASSPLPTPSLHMPLGGYCRPSKIHEEACDACQYSQCIQLSGD